MDESDLPISGAVEYFIAVFATVVVKQLYKEEHTYPGDGTFSKKRVHIDSEENHKTCGTKHPNINYASPKRLSL